MNNKKDILVSFVLDIFSINLSWIIFYRLKIESGLFQNSVQPDLILPMIIILCYWQFFFALFGLYRSWHTKSRFDEISAVFKSISFGSLLFFMLISFNDSSMGATNESRSSMITYWGILFLSVGGIRFIYRTTRRKLLRIGIGLENALIIGTAKLSKKLFNDVKQYPLLGLRPVGIVSMQAKIDKKEENVIGTFQNLEKIIYKNKVEHLLIALESSHHKNLIDIISKCPANVSLKIIPDMYDIISGQARTNQIYGFPLIEIMPTILKPWEVLLKRLLDVFVSLIILILAIPVTILIAIAIKINSSGPIFFSQERIGRNEKKFFMKKFRSMINNAEKNTGPIWSPKNDNRITIVGKFLRKTRLDEIPQFFNVLKGEMSLVGPRPERKHFIDRLEKEIPLYKRRLQVKPGITGWAQIKHGYDETIDDVRTKVKYDLYYIENISFRMDIKILLMTFYTMIRGKGQ